MMFVFLLSLATLILFEKKAFYIGFFFFFFGRCVMGTACFSQGVSKCGMTVVDVSQLGFGKCLERIDAKADRIVAPVVFSLEHESLQGSKE